MKGLIAIGLIVCVTGCSEDVEHRKRMAEKEQMDKDVERVMLIVKPTLEEDDPLFICRMVGKLKKQAEENPTRENQIQYQALDRLKYDKWDRMWRLYRDDCSDEIAIGYNET